MFLYQESHVGVVFGPYVSGIWAPLTSIKHPFVTPGMFLLLCPYMTCKLGHGEHGKLAPKQLCCCAGPRLRCWVGQVANGENTRLH